MFTILAAALHRNIKTRGVSDKTRAASFLNGFENIPHKAYLLGVQTKVHTKLIHVPFYRCFDRLLGT